MKIALLLAAALAAAAPAARAQEADALPGPSSAPSTAVAAVGEPLPAALVPSQSSGAEGARNAAERMEAQRRRSPWRYPVIGAAGGALAGAVFGTVLMAQADEWLAPPAHFFTIPAGAVLGLAIGGVANLIDRP